MNVAACQINCVVGDVGGNEEKIVRALREAKGKGADLIVFPELALVGYPPEDLVLKKSFVDQNLQALERVAQEVRECGAIVGFVDRQHERLFNAAALLADGGVCGIYHKIALPNYGVFDEKRLFSPGVKVPIYRFQEMRLGVTICEDIWEKQEVAPACARQGVDCIVNISASPYHVGKQREREEKVARQFVADCNAALFYVNLVGGQDELVFDGGSFAMDWRQRVSARAPLFREGIFTWEVDWKKKRVEGEIAPLRTIEEEIFEGVVLGLRDYVRKNGFEKVLVGLSGGIDSSLVAALACEALGKEAVVGVFMPSPFTSKESQHDVEELVKNLGLVFHTIPIERVFSAFQEELAPHLGRELTVPYENLQARIRGTLLMALSNQFQYLVLSTGNKSEVSAGYATLYGDMAGGFAPISDLLKEEVYALARFCNQRGAGIPENIFQKAPTAELRPGQKDTDSLPPYEVLDAVLREYVEENGSMEELAQRYPQELVERVVQMVNRNEYKRRQKPPGVKISHRAFGRDRRMPITNRFYG